jgi:hypothetical protein
VEWVAMWVWVGVGECVGGNMGLWEGIAGRMQCLLRIIHQNDAEW